MFLAEFCSSTVCNLIIQTWPDLNEFSRFAVWAGLFAPASCRSLWECCGYIVFLAVHYELCVGMLCFSWGVWMCHVEACYRFIRFHHPRLVKQLISWTSHIRGGVSGLYGWLLLCYSRVCLVDGLRRKFCFSWLVVRLLCGKSAISDEWQLWIIILFYFFFIHPN